MSARNAKLIGLLVMLLLVAAATGCGGDGARVGELQTESETVELGSADSVEVEIDMGAGDLEASGGAAELLEADFTYNVEELAPDVTYSDGVLTVSHGEARTSLASLFDLDEFRNEWDLRFSDEVPMTMNVSLGAGESVLELGSLDLDRLVIDLGAGDLTLDLTGQPSVDRLELSVGAGDATVDLTGDWSEDLEARIDGGAGGVTVRLPSGVGVRVEVSAGLGDINTTGLDRDGDAYVTDAYGESDVTLDITINAGIGEVNLEVE